MAQLTQQQVAQYNKKVEELKNAAAQDRAKKEYAEQELTRLCGELSVQLGHTITPDTLEDEYAAFEAEALRTIESGTRIMESVAREAADAVASATVTPVHSTSVAQTVLDSSTPVQHSLGIELDELLGDV
jgi:hypothetical protein